QEDGALRGRRGAVARGVPRGRDHRRRVDRTGPDGRGRRGGRDRAPVLAGAAARSTDDVLPRTAQLLAAATGAERATVWLRVGRQIRPAAGWPEDDGARSPLAL